MKTKSSEALDTRLYSLALYQIIGGLVGLFFMVRIFLSLESVESLLVAFLVAGIALYCFSVYCGVYLFIKKDYGLRVSLLNQFLQLVSFSIAGYAFEYVSGLSITIDIDFTNLFNVGFSGGLSNWHLLFNGDASINFIRLNIFALLLIVFISRLRKKIQIEQLENEMLG